ncbi:tail fiber protein [Pseudomonas silvicola]|nr:tail fiber protein [Pseudomonas silvicola]
MSDPYVGEVRLFAGARVPVNWHLCDGSLVNIAQNEVLFSLLGTVYGGDGITTFGLPDLRGRVPVGQGTGTGLSPKVLGSLGGTETVTLLEPNLPPHTHSLTTAGTTGTTATAGSGVTFAAVASPAVLYVEGSKAASEATAAVTIPGTLGLAGQNQAHENLMPVVALNYIISLSGIYPSRP